MMVIDNKYDLKQIVYLVTDQDQVARMVVSIRICIDGGLIYELVNGTQSTTHFEAELSAEKNYVTATA